MEQTQQPREQGIGAMSKSMLIVMILTMVSKVTGFLRETVLAANFGATYITDAFKSADLLPCIVLSTIVTALSATLIPAYSGQLKLGRDKANRFINNLFTIGLIFSVLILILTALFLEPIAGLMMAGAEEQTRELAVRLARIMMPMGVFVFLARITGAYLQANYNFTVPALSQLFLNVVIIGSIMISGGADITYVAVGTVLGWALQFAIQLPSVKKAGLRYRPVFDMREPGFREVLILMIPVLLSSAFDQLYMTFDQMVAYQGAVGDPTRLNYANRVSTMVSATLLTTVATVLYPNLVRHVDDKKKFADDLSFGINLNLLIALPASVAIILLRTPVTRAVYERGEFLASDTAITSTLLACYCAGILGIGIRELCNRCFYAFRDTVIPTVVGVGVVVLNIVLNYALHAIMGVAGIAVATAISASVSALVLLILLQRKQHVLDGARVLRCLWKTAVATAAMAAVVLVLIGVFSLNVRGGMSMWLGMAVTAVAGVLAYVAVLFVLRSEELTLLLSTVKKRLAKKG